MKMKKMAAVLSAAAMAVTSLSVAAFAEDTVVTDFAGLKEAVNAKKTDIKISQTITIDESIDLTGVTLTATAKCSGAMIKITGTDITVEGGTFDGGNKDHYVIDIPEGGNSVTLKGAVVSNDPGDNYDTNPPVTAHSIIRNYGTLNLEGATVTSKNGAAAVKSEEGTTLNVKGGVISGKEIGITTYGATTVSDNAKVSSETKKTALYVLTYGDYESKTTVKDAEVTGTIVYGASTGSSKAPAVEITKDAKLVDSGLAKSENSGMQGLGDNKVEAVIDNNADLGTTFAVGEEVAATVVVGENDTAINEALDTSKENVTFEDAEGNEVLVSDDKVYTGYTGLKWGDKGNYSAEAYTIPESTKVNVGDKIVVEFVLTGSAAKAQFKIGYGDGKLLPGFMKKEGLGEDSGKWNAEIETSPYEYELTEDDIKALNPALAGEAAAQAEEEGSAIRIWGDHTTHVKVKIVTKQAEPAKAPTVKIPEGEKTYELEENTWPEGDVTHKNYQKSVALFENATIDSVKAMTENVAVKVNFESMTVGDGSKLNVMLILQSTGEDNEGSIWETLASGNFADGKPVTLSATAAKIKETLEAKGAKGTVNLLIAFGTATDDPDITSAPKLAVVFGDKKGSGDNKPDNNQNTGSNIIGGIIPNIKPAAPDAAVVTGGSDNTAASEPAVTTAQGGNASTDNAGDKNQATGVFFAVIPAAAAAAGVIISKKRK